MSDKLYLSLYYYFETGKVLHLKNPKTFNEKIQWLKLYNRKPEYTKMVDKYIVKEYVAGIIGTEHIIPTIGVWDTPDDILFDSLPCQFVLKTTNGGGSSGVIICKDKALLDKEKTKRQLWKSLRCNIYDSLVEWPYKNVKPRIIAEKYINDGGEELVDYKVLTFGGEPKIIEVDYGRFTNHCRNSYTVEWKKLDAVIYTPSDPQISFPKPSVLPQLLDFSRSLSKGTPHLRVDFYIVNNHIYFGELTFFQGSGMMDISPNSFAYEMGEWIILPR